ncbi:IS5/IS1182 family transposase, partial [Sinorhizobium medicae]|nr:IS5/IS1182 family transposase [Sinorhizobium medicae]MDX0581238.1 IS5/IS1182 family transposase [Sinorhizobium medicae]MDX0784845.1 IS5/IS1182 family transposase [Sinorhizobium medicae]
TSGYASDVTDREWDFVAPFMPAPRRARRQSR